MDVPLAVTNSNNNDICDSANLATRSYSQMLLLNATSLRKPNALQHLATDLRQTNSDFGFIVETWFKSVDNDELFSISDYFLFRRDRVCGRRKHGGGVCIYVKSGIDCFVLSPCPTADTNIEILWLHSCFGANEYIFGLCYHPPDPPYDVAEFIDCISNSIDVLTSLYPGAVLCVLGDFNQLDTTFLQCEFGLTQIVDTPTHGNNLLDKVFINVPDGYKTQVFKSLVKTKHQAVLVVPYGASYCVPNKPQKSTLYDLHSHNIDLLRYCIGTFDWSTVFLCQNLQAKYDILLYSIRSAINSCIPSKVIRRGKGDPDYITPLVKSLLRKRSKLLKYGHIEEANEKQLKPAEKINHTIVLTVVIA